ncbi:MAG TPA: hypothetical protein VN658_04160 [Candidatus Acidoferrales bacterium]|nr:hypothetical protein [Candidatus Acidoferrales bacterium]
MNDSSKSKTASLFTLELLEELEKIDSSMNTEGVIEVADDDELVKRLSICCRDGEKAA